MGKCFGVDLGTSNTMFYLKGSGIVLRAPSVVTVAKRSRRDVELLTAGVEAKQMIGKTPSSISVQKPIEKSIIADSDVAAAMLYSFFKRVDAISMFNRPTVVVNAPCGIKKIERDALLDIFYDVGAKDVILLDSPLLAAIGSGLRTGRERGCMVVDVGGGTTESAVISSMGVVSAKTFPIAGDDLDKAIIKFLREKHNIIIGEATAEQLKNKIGSAHPDARGGLLRVFGRSVESGLGASVVVDGAAIRDAMRPEIMKIVRSVMDVLGSTPPELASDILDSGIVLTGGVSRLDGLAGLISERTRISVRNSKKPLESVILGLARIIESVENFADVADYSSH